MYQWGVIIPLLKLLQWLKKPLIVPRVRPRKEQWIRACKFKELGLIDVLHPDQISVEALINWLSKPQLAVENVYRLNFKGLETLLARTTDILERKAIQRKQILQNSNVINFKTN